jgi:hypothetical protein
LCCHGFLLVDGGSAAGLPDLQSFCHAASWHYKADETSLTHLAAVIVAAVA